MKFTYDNTQNRALNNFYLRLEEFEDFDVHRLYRYRAKTIETIGQFLYDIYISADEGLVKFHFYNCLISNSKGLYAELPEYWDISSDNIPI